jgi:hypothetical protein
MTYTIANLLSQLKSPATCRHVFTSISGILLITYLRHITGSPLKFKYGTFLKDDDNEKQDQRIDGGDGFPVPVIYQAVLRL